MKQRWVSRHCNIAIAAIFCKRVSSMAAVLDLFPLQFVSIKSYNAAPTWTQQDSTVPFSNAGRYCTTSKSMFKAFFCRAWDILNDVKCTVGPLCDMYPTERLKTVRDEWKRGSVAEKRGWLKMTRSETLRASWRNGGAGADWRRL